MFVCSREAGKDGGEFVFTLERSLAICPACLQTKQAVESVDSNVQYDVLLEFNCSAPGTLFSGFKTLKPVYIFQYNYHL